MTTSGKISLWLTIISLAILLDLLILRVWRQYRTLRAAQVEAESKISPRALWGTAIRTTWRDVWCKFPGERLARIFAEPLEKKENPILVWSRTHLFRWPLIHLVLALGVMYAGQFLMVNLPKARGWGLGILIGGVVLIFFRQKLTFLEKFHWTDGFQIGLGFLISLPLAINVNNWMSSVAPWSQIFLWLGAVLLVVAPAFKLKAVPLNIDWPPVGPLLRWEKFFLGGLLVGSFMLRVISVGDIPRPIDPDEASLGMFLIDVIEGRYRLPFGTGWATHPGLQYFLIAPLVSFIQNPIVLMKMPSVILGTLSVGAFYLAARTGAGRQVGVTAAILLMCSDVGIHFSRLGVNNISDSLFATGMIAALWLAASTGRPLAYVMTGVAIGLGQYHYFGNRALPFVLLATLAVWSLFNWRKFWRAWRLILYIFLVTLVVAGPLIGLMFRDPYTLDRIPRVATIFTKKFVTESDKTGESVGNLRWQQVEDSFLVFTVVPDRGSFYKPDRAMLPSILAPLFYIGVLVLFLNWRKPVSQSILLWILVFITLGSVMINTAATFQRLLGMYPAVLLVVALGLEASAEVVPQQTVFKKLTTNGIMAIVTLLAAVGSLYFYFSVFQYQIVWKVSDQEAAAMVAREYVNFEGEGTFALHTRLGIGEDGTVYLPMMKIVAGNNFIGDISQINPETAERPIRIYFFYDKFEELSDVRNQFPGGDIKGYRRYADGEILLIRYTIP